VASTNLKPEITFGCATEDVEKKAEENESGKREQHLSC